MSNLSDHGIQYYDDQRSTIDPETEPLAAPMPRVEFFKNITRNTQYFADTHAESSEEK